MNSDNFFDSNQYKEGMESNEIFNSEKIEGLSCAYKTILGLLGEDEDREGLRETPNRVAKAMQYMTHGYKLNPREIISGSLYKEPYKQMVLVNDIEMYSLCEHHLLPFFGKAHVAYIPNGYITGLSKIVRVVEAFSRRLQVQERLTLDIRDCIQDTLKPLGVAVVIQARHLCMEMRGVRNQNSRTTTSAFTGAFLNSPKTREEFFHLVNIKHE